MLIQVQTDRNIEGREALTERVETSIHDALDRYADRITRVQVHLGDENSDKKAAENDIRCTIEVRLAGLDPIAVRDDAPTIEQAVDGAVGKLIRAAETTLGRERGR
jgi:ribosome-associated translation inhibitor RaiA